MYIKKIKLNYY